MEFDAFPELEFPCQFVDGLPGDRKAGNQALLFVLADKTAKNMKGDGVVRSEIVEMRVHGRGFGSQADGDFLRGCRCDRHNGGQTGAHHQGPAGAAGFPCQQFQGFHSNSPS